MNEFYYYDGETFQKCLTLNNIKVPVNQDYQDLASFISNGKIEKFLTVGKIENKCFYDLDNIKAYFHILTDRGFELVTTESMNVRAAGLNTKDFVNVTVKPVLLIAINEKIKINKIENFKNLNSYEVVDPIVRLVPRSDVTDIFNLEKINLQKEIAVVANAIVIFNDNINKNIVEKINLSRIDLQNLSSIEKVKILLNEIEI